MKRILCNIFFLFFAISLIAQDIHFSNFHTNVLNVNPAFAGYFKGKYRISATYRNQYRTVAVPYQTYSIGFDSKYIRNHSLKNTFGYGFLLNYDVAGDANLKTTQINIPLANHHSLANKKVLFSYSIMPAIIFNSIDFTYLRFPEQFDGTQYDPDILPTENFNTPNTAFFNFSSGLQTTYKHSKNFTYTIGVAGYNLTKPNMSFFDNDEIELHRRLLIHGLAILSIKPQVDVVPAFKMQFQGSQKEFHFGSLFIRYFDNINILSISGGGWFRSRDKDAIILGLGCNYLGYDIICNYDINISNLKQASNGHGAFELTVSNIIFDYKKKRKMSPVKCPSYL